MSATLPAPSVSELEALVEKWARILKVQDWALSLEIVRQYKIPGCWAETEFYGGKRIARIRLLDPSLPVDVDDPLESHNPELSIIHELLHVKLVQIEPEKKGLDDPLYFDYHASLDQLAVAFYELSRPFSRLNLDSPGPQIYGTIIDVPLAAQSVESPTYDPELFDVGDKVRVHNLCLLRASDGKYLHTYGEKQVDLVGRVVFIDSASNHPYRVDFPGSGEVMHQRFCWFRAEELTLSNSSFDTQSVGSPTPPMVE